MKKLDDFYCENVLNKKIKVKVVKETKRVLAYYYTKPFWQVHIVVVPKMHIASLKELKDKELIVELLEVLNIVSNKVKLKYGSCRILTNLGGYQDSKHLHFHVSYGEHIK